MQQIGVPNIEKLEGARNFASWSFAMKNTLIVSDLWDFVESPGTMQEHLGEAQFKRLDAKTKAKICLSVSTSIYPVIMSSPTAQETWKKLQTAYADSGLLRRLHLLRKLFNTRLENCQCMEEYVNGIRSTQQQLAEIKAPVDDEFVGVIMLTGLTEKYNPMVMALEGSGTKISSDSVATMLLIEVHEIIKYF
ncbi:gag-polypeptide of LTR copia-type domain-containing protein [Phthorimaea operculella]|nr:gag-polypeptide of LTR copia-type domain-containing protein [Phthorimaea operculella]